jgi:hypothetical protein
VTDKDRPRWPRFKTKEAAREIAGRCHAMERQTKVHWRVVNMEDGSWIVAAYKDGGMPPIGQAKARLKEAESAGWQAFRQMKQGLARVRRSAFR